MTKITLLTVTILAAYAGVISSLASKCCLFRDVKGGTGIQNGMYKFLEEDELSAKPEGCVDNCIYVKNEEKFCFKMEAGATADVTCAAMPSTSTTTTPIPTPFVILIGGNKGTMKTWTPFNFTPPSYNPLTIERQSGLRAANLDGQFYACGAYRTGSKEQKKDMKKCWTTRIDQQTWTPAADLIVGRQDLSLTAVGDTLVAAGGYDEETVRLSSVEMLKNGQWTQAGWSLRERVYQHCAVADSNSSLVIIGGFNSVLGRRKHTTRYNIKTGEKTDITELPVALQRHACTMYQNKITVSGGKSDDVNYQQKVWQLDGNQWVELPSLNYGRRIHEMVVLNNSLYVFGGSKAEKIIERLDDKQWTVMDQGLPEEFRWGSSIVVE